MTKIGVFLFCHVSSVRDRNHVISGSDQCIIFSYVLWSVSSDCFNILWRCLCHHFWSRRMWYNKEHWFYKETCRPFVTIYHSKASYYGSVFLHSWYSLGLVSTSSFDIQFISKPKCFFGISDFCKCSGSAVELKKILLNSFVLTWISHLCFIFLYCIRWPSKWKLLDTALPPKSCCSECLNQISCCADKPPGSPTLVEIQLNSLFGFTLFSALISCSKNTVTVGYLIIGLKQLID